MSAIKNAHVHLFRQKNDYKILPDQLLKQSCEDLLYTNLNFQNLIKSYYVWRLKNNT